MSQFDESTHPRDGEGKFSGGGLDHGLLNIPLAKRGNIDSQLDKYKADQLTIARDKRKETAAENKETKALAKEALSVYGEAMIERYGAKFGHANLKATFSDWQKWEPKKLLSFVEKYKRENASAN